MLNVVAVGDLDPAGVLCGWREALRASGAGVELRVATRWAYSPLHLRADWYGQIVPWGEEPATAPSGLDGLRELLEWADLIVLNPGLGRPWSGSAEGPFVEPAQEFAWLPAHKRRPQAYVIHGSRATWAHRDQYRLPGYVAATTLDYVHELGATYLPPALFDVWGTAYEREAQQPPLILQAATDPLICHSAELRDYAIRRQVHLQTIRGHLHASAMAHKLSANIGFDHLRGSFSVNTAEYALLGLAPVCLLRPEYRAPYHVEVLEGLPATIAPSEAAVWEAMDRLVLDWEWHREVQRSARQWALRLFSPAAVAQRLAAFFRSAA